MKIFCSISVEKRLAELEKELQDKQQSLEETQKRLDEIEKQVGFHTIGFIIFLILLS